MGYAAIEFSVYDYMVVPSSLEFTIEGFLPSVSGFRIQGFYHNV